MSELILFRHGQADAFGADYDRLTATGREQSQRLGEYLAAKGMRFDEIYTGPRTRQIDTCELTGAELIRAELPWPEPQLINELDEYDGNGIMRTFAPMLAERDERIRTLVAANAQSGSPRDRYRNFQLLFEAVAARWVSGDVSSSEVEPWPAFRARVQRGMARITQGGARGRRIGVFTSGGPISITVQAALTAPPEMAIELNWRIRNSSLTGIVFSGDRHTLDYFNAVPHLSDSSLWTYR